jgi:hypothetical protein
VSYYYKQVLKGFAAGVALGLTAGAIGVSAACGAMLLVQRWLT